MSDRVEIVTTNAGHHVRIVASNGEPIATTEVYPDSRDAEHAVIVLARVFGVEVASIENYLEANPFNVVFVDERV
jgi:uncharacterized protein YegP (UPF0339 family)